MESDDMYNGNLPTPHKRLFGDFAIGDLAYIDFLVTEMEEKPDRKGDPFIFLSATDGEQTIGIRHWSSSAAAGYTVGDVVHAKVLVKDYNGSKSYTIASGDASVVPDADPYAFVRTPPIPIEKMWKEVRGLIASMRYPYRDIAEALVLDNEADYKNAAAGRSIHHAYCGGLLYHSYRIALGARKQAEIYGADLDVVTCGALIHDIGKLRELDTDMLGTSSYTVVGKLEHHTLIGIRMLDAAAMSLGVDPDCEDVRMLRHVIASHHGTREFGAITEPMTKEAYIVHSQDVLDMQLSIYDDHTTSAMPGQVVDTRNSVVRQAYVPGYSA